MTTELALTNDQQAELIKKQSAFSKFYEQAYKTEISIANKANLANDYIIIPQSIDDLPAAEANLTNLKKLQQEIKDERSVITKKLDDMGSRFISYEKQLQPAINEITALIIAVKKEHEQKLAFERQARQAIEAFRQHVVNVKIHNDAHYKKIIQLTIGKAYEDALNGAVKSIDELEPYLQNIAVKFTPASFNGKKINRINTGLSDKQIDDIIAELYNIDIDDYVMLFNTELENRFSDYEVALNNKQYAISAAKLEAQAVITELELNKESAKLEVDIQAAINFDTPDTYVKPLKKSFVVDMDDNMQNALKIMAAFSGNLNLCLPKLKITKWMAFTPTQAANALGKVKSDDNNFAPAGITFKEVDKL